VCIPVLKFLSGSKMVAPNPVVVKKRKKPKFDSITIIFAQNTILCIRFFIK
jgi:hypothetical protein